MQLKPLFSYFGSKWRIGPRYPKPRHDTIIEPFAGSAGYSLRYADKQIILYDLDPVVAGLWDYLVRVSEEEILSLPTEITDLREMDLTQEQKWLIGFWVNKGNCDPWHIPCSWMRSGLKPHSFWGEYIRKRIADQLKHIRHWKIYNKSYDEAPNMEATYFVDPPYEKNGKDYAYKFRAYDQLAKWCQERWGQIIVCEQAPAAWLPFQEFRKNHSTYKNKGRGTKVRYSQEVIWTNDMLGGIYTSKSSED